MWADALYLAERHHVLVLAAWGVACMFAGTVMLALLALRRVRSELVRHFAIQTAAWGAVILAIALVARRGLTYRDLDAFTRLDRFLWLNVGLDAGYAMVGVTLALLGWRLGRRMGLVGAGFAVVVQGLALLVLDARLIAVLNRLAAG